MILVMQQPIRLSSTSTSHTFEVGAILRDVVAAFLELEHALLVLLPLGALTLRLHRLLEHLQLPLLRRLMSAEQLYDLDVWRHCTFVVRNANDVVGCADLLVLGLLLLGVVLTLEDLALGLQLGLLLRLLLPAPLPLASLLVLPLAHLLLDEVLQVTTTAVSAQ